MYGAQNAEHVESCSFVWAMLPTYMRIYGRVIYIARKDTHRIIKTVTLHPVFRQLRIEGRLGSSELDKLLMLNFVTGY